jgi:hypothetical protein
MISTRDLSRLPDVDGLRGLLQSLAMLDAILCPEWQYRFYSFNSRWSKGEQMGSMRNGQGDDFFALFNAAGCFLKGFAHEAAMSPYRDDGTQGLWPGLIESVPAEFAACLREPAFGIDHTTFCIWRRHGDSAWRHGVSDFPPGDDPDGSAYLLSPLDGNPQTYRDWAERYYGGLIRPGLSLEAVRHVHEQRPLTPDLVATLNPDLVDDPKSPRRLAAALQEEIKEIGYPRGRRKK